MPSRARKTIEFDGQFPELKEYFKRLSKLPKSAKIVNEQLAEETLDLIREGFETSTDPYGNAWESPKLRAGRPMEDTGGLKSSWHARVANGTFTVASGKEYAAMLQRGTGIYNPRRRQPIKPLKAKALKLPGGLFFRQVDGAEPRKMVPDKGGLPKRWRDRYEEVAQEVLTELVSKTSRRKRTTKVA